MSTASFSTGDTTRRSSRSTIARRSSRSIRAARLAYCATPSWRPIGRRNIGEIKYQIGGGCLTDQILGQWHADLAGLGDLLVAATMSPPRCRSIFSENFRATLRDHFNPCRVYAYEDEAGLLVCTWPEGTEKPATPVPYSEEVWTGLEYMVASHLIARGFVDEGLTIVRAARARHDGSRRNPWNEIECGSYYARSLSSYALLNAYIGLTFDQRADEIGFRPARAGRCGLFLVRGAGLGRNRVSRPFRDSVGQGRRARRFAAALADFARTRPRSTGGRPSGTATSSSSASVGRCGQASISSWERTSVARLELKGVRKSFQSVEVIHGVDLTVETGSFTVFVGPSGCGKSTLLRMIAGLEDVTAGEILLDGRRCDHLIPAARGMAMVFQSYALYPHMSVRENLRFGLVCQGLAKAEIAARIAARGRHPADRRLFSSAGRRNCRAARASASRSAARS